jgi:hypothetical protein
MTEVVDQLRETRSRDQQPRRPVLPPLARPTAVEGPAEEGEMAAAGSGTLRVRSTEADLTEAICRVLEASSEPLTPAKVRAQLPTALRRLSPESLTAVLTRQVEAGVLYDFCPYRSQQRRFWSRPLTEHVAVLIRTVLADGPLTLSQLFRRLPEYAAGRAREVLDAQLGQGRLHRHPGSGPRGGERYGLQPLDPRGPLRQELARLFERLGQRLGCGEDQLRSAALEVLQDDEWNRPQDASTSEPQDQE